MPGRRGKGYGLTVRREAWRAFDAEEGRLVEAARRVLDGDPIYRDTRQDGTSLTATVKPNPFYLETAMRVRVRPAGEAAGSKSIVRVTTVSQPFIQADVAGFYDRYLQGFLDALERRLEDPSPEGAAPGVRGKSIWGLSGAGHGRWVLAAGLVLVSVLVVLPAVLALSGFGGIALAIIFFPFAAAAGFGLARFSALVRRRFGTMAALLAAVPGFLLLCAIFIVAGILVSEALIPGRRASTSTVGSGLVTGILAATFSGAKPDGFDGGVSPEGDVQGLRGYFSGIGRALLGGPLFRGNLAMMGLMLSGGLLLTAFGTFAAVRGGVSSATLFVTLLGLGNLLLGVAETVPLGPVPVSVAMRVAGLLAGFTALSTVLFGLLPGLA